MLDRSDRATIVVSGRDRASYLQGLFTNDVGALGAGQGCYAAYLTPQGRMIAELWVYELGDVMLLALPAGVKDAVLSRLDQFVFSEDVQLGDTSARSPRARLSGRARQGRSPRRSKAPRSKRWRRCPSMATCARAWASTPPSWRA